MTDRMVQDNHKKCPPIEHRIVEKRIPHDETVNIHPKAIGINIDSTDEYYHVRYLVPV